jgi:hypothetical protein
VECPRPEHPRSRVKLDGTYGQAWPSAPALQVLAAPGTKASGGSRAQEATCARSSRRASRVHSDGPSGVAHSPSGSLQRLAAALSNSRNICLLFESSTGTVGGMSTSPTATTSPAAIDPVAAPRERAPRAGFAPARAQLARLEATALAATRAAAMACQRWIGRGSGQAADAAATDAMRSALATAPGTGTVVIGEGVKDRAPMLYDGELVGTRRGPSFDIAVDPLECTTLCAKGLPGSLATIAFAEAGSMARVGPSFYMDKLVGPPATREAIDITDAPKANLARVAQALE